MTREEKRTFFNWLQQNGALERFKRNRFNFLRTYKNSGWANYRSYAQLPYLCAVDYAFIWSDTPEGYIFWQKLDDAWCKRFF